MFAHNLLVGSNISITQEVAYRYRHYMALCLLHRKVYNPTGERASVEINFTGGKDANRSPARKDEVTMVSPPWRIRQGTMNTEERITLRVGDHIELRRRPDHYYEIVDLFPDCDEPILLKNNLLFGR